MSHIPNESTSPFPDLGTPHPKTQEIPHAHVGRRHLRSSIVSALFLLVLMIGLTTTLYFLKTPQDIRNRAASTGPKLSIEPSNKQAKVGETIPLGITLTTGDDTVSAVELHLTYDPVALEIVSFKEGEKFPTVLEEETHASGTVNVTLGTQPTTPFKGTSIIGTLTVKQVSNKASKIAFASTTKVASIGKTTNSLAGTSEAQISSGGGTSSSPTPTPTSGNNNQRVLVPTSTPPVTGSTEIYSPPANNSFGSLNTTSQPSVTTTNYIPPQQTISQPPSLPQVSTSLPTPTPIAKPTNFIENIFIAIGSFFQTLFSSQKNSN